MSWRLMLVAVSASTATLVAQSTQAPVFRGRIDIVPVTVTVVDKKGRPVTDLQASDFVITENGRPREIAGFYPQLFGPGALSAPVSSGLMQSRQRTFLIALGYGRIQIPGKGLDGALDFVRHRLLPGDKVALMAFHRVSEFTIDHARIVDVLERYKAVHEDLMFKIRVHFLSTRGFGRGGPPLPEALLAEIDGRVFGTGAARMPTRSIDGLLLGMDRATPVVHAPGQKPVTFAEMSARYAAYGVNLRDATIMNNRLRLYAGVEHLRQQDGDKRLMFIAESGVAFSKDDAGILARRATDARLAIDFIWTAGTRLRGGSGCLPCRDLTELTGGYYTSLEYASQALAKIDAESRHSYLIGYVPVNTELDGKYRQIRVIVNRPDLDVRFRHGYYAAEEPDPAELAAAVARTYTEAASTYDLTASDIPIALSAQAVPDTGVPREIRVDLKIGMADVSLLSDSGRFRGELEIRIYCGDAKEKVVGSQVARMTLDAPAETHEQWLQDGLRNTVTVPVTAAPKYVKAIVFDPGSNRAGSVVITLKPARQ